MTIRIDAASEFDSPRVPRVVSRPEPPTPKPERIPVESLDSKPVTTVQLIPDDQPIPDGWLEADGTELRSSEYPEFRDALGITGSTFALPAPQRGPSGRVWIIKVGVRRG